jgi:hypothetical protein
VGGRNPGGAVETMEEDFARVWPGTRGAEEALAALADGFRRCREAVSGGLERSCLTGSEISRWLTFDCRVENDRCSPLLVGLPMLARAEGGRVETLLTTLLAVLGGLADVDDELEVKFRVGGLTGSRLGDWLPLSLGLGSGSLTLLSFSPGSWADARVYLVPVSAGLRSERDLVGTVDISLG